MAAVIAGVGEREPGHAIYPHPWPDPGIEAFAAACHATVAVPRHQASP